jgi:cell division protein FtsL
MARSAATAPARAPRKSHTETAPKRTRPQTAPARRKSGPARPKQQITAPRRTAPSRAPARNGSAPTAPARKGPARKAPARTTPAPTAPRRAPSPRRPAVEPGALRRVLAARGNVLLDRLLRGRIWVVCVGGLLAGIVFLNVGLLQLNDQIARTDKKAAQIGRENSDLRLRLAKLDSTERIQRLAEQRGFVMPAPGAVRYVKSRRGDARNAARRTTAPDPPAAPVAPAAPQPTAGTTPVGTAPGTTAAPGTPAAPGTTATPPPAAAPATTQQTAQPPPAAYQVP